MEEQITIAPIKLSDVERMVASVKKNVDGADVDLSFEFMLTDFLPSCWNNIQEALNRQYTLGYIAGTKDARSTYRSSEDDADCYCE